MSCGPQGSQGITGPPGPNGEVSLLRFVSGDTSCVAGGTLVLAGLDTNGDGVLQVSEVTSSADLCNGTNGINGQSPAFTPTIAITPCGPNSAQYKEALLGLFGGGVFSEFTNTNISNIMLPDGSYWDTDTSECNFSLTTDGSGNRSMTWNGSSANGSGPYHAGSASYNAATESWTASY